MIGDAAVARLGLERYDAGMEPRLEFIRHGENSTYRVDTDRSAWALRVHRPGYRTVDEVRSEVAWMEALRESGVPTPQAVRALDGDVVVQVETPIATRLVSALTWQPGESMALLAGDAPWRRLGALMGEVREHGRRWQRPTWFTRWSWDAAGMLGPDAHWGDPSLLPDWDPATRDLVDLVREEVLLRLAAFGRGADRYGLVHADLAFHNILVDGARSVLIDFDDCGWSWFMWELGVALAPLDGTPEFDHCRDELVAGYRETCGVSDEELAELPTFIMARRLVTLGWVLMHAETEHAMAQRERRIATFPEAARRYLNLG